MNCIRRESSRLVNELLRQLENEGRDSFPNQCLRRVLSLSKLREVGEHVEARLFELSRAPIKGDILENVDGFAG